MFQQLSPSIHANVLVCSGNDSRAPMCAYRPVFQYCIMRITTIIAHAFRQGIVIIENNIKSSNNLKHNQRNALLMSIIGIPFGGILIDVFHNCPIFVFIADDMIMVIRLPERVVLAEFFH